jgi:hypothetical protein
MAQSAGTVGGDSIVPFAAPSAVRRVTRDRAMTQVTPVHDTSGGLRVLAIQWLFRGESVVVTDAAAPSREQADISAITEASREGHIQ